ncbi:hypothetical protein AHAS_Ahas18G0104400 [Arachis hypogaea]
MLGREISFDIVTYTSLIYDFCHVGQWKEAGLLLNEIFVKDTDLDVYTINIIIDALCKEEMLLQAHDLCDVIILRGQQPNITTYTILMNGYYLNKKVYEARNLFDMNIVPNIVTYNSLVDGLCKAGRILSTWEIVNEMHYYGQPFPDHLDEAIALFKSLIFERNFVPNVWSYNILISGYCKNKRFDEAMKPFQYICSKNLDPNIETYNILLHALCDRQQLGKAIILLNQIVDDDICPNLYTYKILIHGLLNSGRVEECTEDFSIIFSLEEIMLIYLGIGKVAYSSFDHSIFVEAAVMETLPGTTKSSDSSFMLSLTSMKLCSSTAAPTLQKASPPVPTKMLVAFNKLTALPSEGNISKFSHPSGKSLDVEIDAKLIESDNQNHSNEQRFGVYVILAAFCGVVTIVTTMLC